MFLRFSLVVVSGVALSLASASAQQSNRSSPQVNPNPPPSTAEKYTVPGTGGYVWGSGQNSLAPPTSMGGSVGVQYPPQTPTRAYCNGKPC
jgi:hypothetical protein